MNESTCKVLKLTNGEDIVCELGDGNTENEYEIGYPLKMEVQSKMTKNGIIESLNLTRWIGPYTEQPFFLIKTSHILLIAEASHGLSRYYEHVIRKIDTDWNNEEAISPSEEEDVYDDLLMEAKLDSKLIH